MSLPLNPFNDHPIPPYRFISREADLYRLRLLAERERPIVSIAGMPGVGKTSLANVFVSTQPGLTPVRLYGSTLRNLNLEKAIEQASLGAKLPLLVVIDSADELQFDQLQDHLRAIINLKRVHMVLMTSRTSLLELARAVGPISEINLEPLTDRQIRSWSETKEGLIYNFVEETREPEDRIIKLSRPPIIFLNNEIIMRLQKYPNDVRDLTPRQFEELIADLLADQGCEVELTQETRDGGVDIFAKVDTPIGKVLTLVDAKRYKETRPVGVELVRQLLGTLHDSSASHGMLVTTSRFTHDAQAVERRHAFELSLRDYGDVVSWLAGYKGHI